MTAAAANARVILKMELVRMVNLVSPLMDRTLHSMHRVLTRCGLADDQLVIKAP